MTSIYTDGSYLHSTKTWHAEDSSWKAAQISRLLQAHDIAPKVIGEIGCGAGGVLAALRRDQQFLPDVRFIGYDISPQAISLASIHAADRLTFVCDDMTINPPSMDIDILLVIDVFEHIPDYMGFVSKCRSMAALKVYHIPLDIHVSSVVRDTFDAVRNEIGHIHSFTASSALATLRDTGHEIVDQFYTDGALALFRQHRSVKRGLANVPRWIVSRFSVSMAARLLGGYSLLVLAR